MCEIIFFQPNSIWYHELLSLAILILQSMAQATTKTLFRYPNFTSGTTKTSFRQPQFASASTKMPFRQPNLTPIGAKTTATTAAPPLPFINSVLLDPTTSPTICCKLAIFGFDPRQNLRYFPPCHYPTNTNITSTWANLPTPTTPHASFYISYFSSPSPTHSTQYPIPNPTSLHL